MAIRYLGLLAGAAMAALAVPATAATVTTPLIDEQTNDGVMFDVSVLGGALTLQSIGINADFGTYDYSVYYRVGGVGSAQNDASAWTLLSGLNAVTTGGLGTLTLLDVADLALAAGTTYGFYVTDGGAFSINYNTSNGAVGDVLASDAALAIRTGYGVSGTFGDVSSPRDFNGSLTYATAAAAVPEPATWGLAIAGFGVVGAAMRRRRVRVAYA